MFVGEMLSNPHDRGRAQGGRVCQCLSEVIVIRLSELIFDDNVIVIRILR